MSFNSITFLIFFITVFILYFITPIRFRWIVLLGASIYFYGSWNWKYLILIFCTTLTSYVTAYLLEKYEKLYIRRFLLGFCIFVSLDLLIMFKYFNFLGSLFNMFWQTDDGKGVIPFLSVLLPVGISFYTFQTLSYVVDVYYRRMSAEKNFGFFALYVTFFPQLVAGPIERATNLIPQLHSPKKFDYYRALDGVHHVIWGLFKKIFIADSMAITVDLVYNDINSYPPLATIIATVFFAFLIYCDFSAYSDIAIGVAKILGYDLMLNFNIPYIACNIDDFWKRWHISLTTWFKDYLYIPLGGNRKGRLRTYINVFIIFLVSGIWHGANVTFVAWGVLHGLYTIIYRLTKKPRDIITKFMNKPVLKQFYVLFTWFITFSSICFAWIFFRANTMDDAITVISGLFNYIPTDIGETLALLNLDNYVFITLIISVLFMGIIEYFQAHNNIFEKFAHWNFVPRFATYIILVLSTLFVSFYFGGSEVKAFVYFQF